MQETESNGTVSTDEWDGEIEADPAGASSFVIAVILIYGLSIIFLIASHVFIKNKAHRESEKQINNYFEQAALLQDESKKETFEQLKWSLIPVIAQSPSGRPLIAKRIKYLPYLMKYGYLPTPPIESAGNGENDSRHHPGTSGCSGRYLRHNVDHVVEYVADDKMIHLYREIYRTETNMRRLRYKTMYLILGIFHTILCQLIQLMYHILSRLWSTLKLKQL